MPFPEEIDITAAWLAEALGHPGTDLSESRRPIGTGQVGENVRFSLTWPDDVPGPSSVVGKFPSLDAQSRETAGATDTYVREIGFYRDLQSTVTTRTPVIHYLAEDLADNRFLLLMEDIAPAEQGDQLAGCSLARAELAIDGLIGLHAPHWGGTSLDHLEWLRPRTAERGLELQAFYSMLFEGFSTRYGSRLSPDDIEIGRRFGPLIAPWFAAPVTPATLVHGDYRLDNMLFGTGAGAPPLTVVDWQTAARGHGPTDLAYFIGAGLLLADRRDHETALFDRYHAGLARAGVDVARDRLWHDYVLGSASGYLMAVVASQIVSQTERGDEMFCVMAERHAAQMRDLELFDLLE